MQQTSRELGVIKKVAGSTWTKAGESSEQTSMVNSREENRSNICKVVDGKLLISALYGMHALTMTEHTTVLKVRVQAGQSGVGNKMSVESMAQEDNFQE